MTKTAELTPPARNAAAPHPVPSHSRADDERVLSILHLIAVYGMSRAAIARKMGVSKGTVIGIVDRVRIADKRASPGEDVDRFYTAGGAA